VRGAGRRVSRAAPGRRRRARGSRKALAGSNIRPRHDFEQRGFHVTLEIEQEIIEPIAIAAQEELEHYIENTTPEGLPGVAARLRYLVDNPYNGDEAAVLLPVIERGIAGGAS
jgi:hypothetical protein